MFALFCIFYSVGVHNMRHSEVYSVSRRLDSSNDLGALLRQPKAAYLELWILLGRIMQHHWRNVRYFIFYIIYILLFQVYLLERVHYILLGFSLNVVE